MSKTLTATSPAREGEPAGTISDKEISGSVYLEGFALNENARKVGLHAKRISIAGQTSNV